MWYPLFSPAEKKEFTLTHVGATADTSDLTAYTFSDHAIGDADSSRLVLVGRTNLLVRGLWSYVLEVNQNFQFNLSGYENAQLAKYENGDFYDWHKDIKENNSGSERKLSATLQLSKPEDYKGCELQLFNGAKELEELPVKNQGSIIVFRSDEWHRATPITEGVRYSLVLWASGDKLK